MATKKKKKKNGRATFGELVLRACRQQGVTQTELSNRLGVSQSRVPQIVRSGNLTEKVLRDCASALGLVVDCRLVKRKEARA